MRSLGNGVTETDVRDKVNQFMRTMDRFYVIYAGRIGMLGLAGNLGNWPYDVLPGQ